MEGAVGITADIIGVLQLTSSITSLAYNYIDGAGDTPQAALKLIDGLNKVKIEVEDMARFITSQMDTQPGAQKQGSAFRYTGWKDLLVPTQVKLETGMKERDRSRALVWPFQEAEMDEIRNTLSIVQDTFVDIYQIIILRVRAGLNSRVPLQDQRQKVLDNWAAQGHRCIEDSDEESAQGDSHDVADFTRPNAPLLQHLQLWKYFPVVMLNQHMNITGGPVDNSVSSQRHDVQHANPTFNEGPFNYIDEAHNVSTGHNYGSIRQSESESVAQPSTPCPRNPNNPFYSPNLSSYTPSASPHLSSPWGHGGRDPSYSYPSPDLYAEEQEYAYVAHRARSNQQQWQGQGQWAQEEWAEEEWAEGQWGDGEGRARSDPPPYAQARAQAQFPIQPQSNAGLNPNLKTRTKAKAKEKQDVSPNPNSISDPNSSPNQNPNSKLSVPTRPKVPPSARQAYPHPQPTQAQPHPQAQVHHQSVNDQPPAQARTGKPSSSKNPRAPFMPSTPGLEGFEGIPGLAEGLSYIDANLEGAMEGLKKAGLYYRSVDLESRTESEPENDDGEDEEEEEDVKGKAKAKGQRVDRNFPDPNADDHVDANPNPNPNPKANPNTSKSKATTIRFSNAAATSTTASMAQIPTSNANTNSNSNSNPITTPNLGSILNPSNTFNASAVGTTISLDKGDTDTDTDNPPPRPRSPSPSRAQPQTRSHTQSPSATLNSLPPLSTLSLSPTLINAEAALSPSLSALPPSLASGEGTSVLGLGLEGAFPPPPAIPSNDAAIGTSASGTGKKGKQGKHGKSTSASIWQKLHLGKDKDKKEEKVEGEERRNESHEKS